VRQRYPLLSQALLSGASPQLRNMASTGGNLMQRPRCGYFTDVAFDMCNKRMPGSGCGAKEGVNRMHAILGASPSCIAVNPSDMNVALAALDANIIIAGAKGERVVPIGEFHRLPGSTPQIETVLQPGEMIVAVALPASPFALHAHYLKVRDRASYAFALVSVAAALDIDADAGVVRGARIALGGVAHKPWRLAQAEAALLGKPLSEQSCRKAAELLTAGARGFKDNQFKIKLAQNAVVRALWLAEGRA
jgi:xanthine dehydrogenase YagS FAD-binding subunit